MERDAKEEIDAALTTLADGIQLLQITDEQVARLGQLANLATGLSRGGPVRGEPSAQLIDCILSFEISNSSGDSMHKFLRPVRYVAVPQIGAQVRVGDENWRVKEICFTEILDPLLILEGLDQELDGEALAARKDDLLAGGWMAS